MDADLSIVVPAKAGIHQSSARTGDKWIPAFAGTTSLCRIADHRFDRQYGLFGKRSQDLRVAREMLATQLRVIDLALDRARAQHCRGRVRLLLRSRFRPVLAANSCVRHEVGCPSLMTV